MRSPVSLGFILLSAYFISYQTATGQIPQAQAEPPPLAAFVNPGLVEEGSFTLSPSGDHYAMIVPRENQSSLIIVDRREGKVSANVTLEKNQYIDDYSWVTDKRIVFSLAEVAKGEEHPTSTGELLGIDVDGKNSRYLYGVRGALGPGTAPRSHRISKNYGFARILEPRADVQDRVLISVRSMLMSVDAPVLLAAMNVHDGTLTYMLGDLPLNDVHSAVVDGGGELRLVSGETAEGFQQVYLRVISEEATRARRNPSSRVRIQEFKWRKIADEARDDRRVYPLAFAADGKHAYVEISQAGGPSYLGLLDPETGKERKVYSPEYADIGPLFMKADASDAYALKTYEERGGYVFLDKDSAEAKLTKSLMDRFPGQLVIANSFSRDGRYASVVVYSDVSPGEYYIYDAHVMSLRRALAVRPSLMAAQLAKTTPIEFVARDGMKIRGLLTLPNNIDNPPMVVLPHGGPYGIMDHWGFDPEVQLLASRGYAVLQVNFRGSGGYGRDFILAGFREWGGKMQDDLTDAVRWVIANGRVDARRICIYGISYGAYAALMGVAKEPDMFRCAIGFSGVYDLAIQTKKSDTALSRSGRMYFKDIFVKDSAWLRARSPNHLAANIKAPVMLIHGGEDERTPPAHAYAMRRALSAAGNPPEWMFVDTEGHGFFDPQNRIKAYQAILDFLDKHIGPADKPATVN